MADGEQTSKDCKDTPSNKYLSLSGDPAQDKLLLQPFHYICQTPGKQIRSKLAQSFNYWMNVPEKKLSQIEEIVEMLHNASLLIDDIEDRSILRRGIPVAHSIYGMASTINASNYVYFMGLERTQALEHPEATSVFCEQLLELHRGQGMDIYWRDNFHCPTEDEYRQMTIRKTGGLFGLATRLMQLFSSCEHDFTKLSSTLGLFFQIRDDYANLCLQEYTESKSFAEDLTEGKFNFPCIHAIATHPDDTRVVNIIRQRTTDVEVKKYCISLLKQFGSFDYTKQTLQRLDAEAREEIALLGGNPHLERVLDSLKV
ncbi:geranylgeranyl pyrophosphate synthase-like [Amphibalanus amphitrite]|uniref:geranylgeranyl pyrophosphate synthase-like n=1 Tax=Amphibalanus amphitrite TaxID=1232801 RepID=UPI001C928A4F|nr:geranylgeranyl pyrophosphate synthase-like [Amphibalanus amphitrite]XP_043193434.1 geranylgeranyl pyrophosphate synthase-like [Amphibalanus amphitrite]XP_043193435.1 geranylgeranyl pyrophosphate synthase-like [Amphibalanus amphitrite]